MPHARRNKSQQYLRLHGDTNVRHGALRKYFPKFLLGDKRVATLERSHIKALVDAKAATPHAANRLLKIFRLLMAHAVDNGCRRDNPTLGIRFLKTTSAGIRTWTEEEVAQYEAHHPPGSVARDAMTLMLYTGKRKGNAIVLGRQHIRHGRIAIAQSKNPDAP